LGFFGSIASTPAAQRGADGERTVQEASRQQGEVKNESLAEKAAGIGETDGDEHSAGERDADGRRPWEIPSKGQAHDDSHAAPPAPAVRQSKDLTGDAGGQLDLTG
jgi:hypothetical protein